MICGRVAVFFARSQLYDLKAGIAIQSFGFATYRMYSGMPKSKGIVYSEYTTIQQVSLHTWKQKYVEGQSYKISVLFSTISHATFVLLNSSGKIYFFTSAYFVGRKIIYTFSVLGVKIYVQFYTWSRGIAAETVRQEIHCPRILIYFS